MKYYSQSNVHTPKLTIIVSQVYYLPLLRPGELGLELLLALLMVSMRESLVCSLPVADKGLFTAPRTLADLGWK